MAQDDASAAGQRRTARRSRIAEASGVLALVISVIALGVSAYQTRLQQQQARNGVWPSLKLSYASADTPVPVVTLRLDNNGVGPAKIESVQVRFDGQPIKRWGDLLLRLGLDVAHFHHSENAINGVVQPPADNRETNLDMLSVRGREPAARLEAALPRLAIDICYCSIYDDCWVVRWHQREATPVARCEVGGADEFEE